MAVFCHDIYILSIGQETAFCDRKLFSVVSDVYSAMNIDKDSKVVPLQVRDELRSKTCIPTCITDNLRRKGETNPLAFPPPKDALRTAVSRLCQLVHTLPHELLEKTLQKCI